MDITVKKISSAEFDAEEQKIRDSHKSLSDLQESWKSLNQFFAGGDSSQARQYWWTYFRVYVDLTRKLYSILEPDTIIKVVFGQQVPVAILIDVDVVKELLLYLSLQGAVEKDIQNLYLQTKEAFIESAAILGVWNDKEVTVAEIVKEFFSIKQRGSDALELAEFNSKLKEILFPKNDPLVNKYVWVDPDTAIYRFIQLILFFYLMEPKDIRYAVDAFMRPEIGGVAGEKEGKISSPSQRRGEGEVLTQATPSNPPLPRPSGESPKPSAPPKLTPSQIRSQMESNFKKDAEGDFEDIAGVYAKLEELAEKYNDPKIAEMLYFDEKSGKFEWKV